MKGIAGLANGNRSVKDASRNILKFIFFSN